MKWFKTNNKSFPKYWNEYAALFEQPTSHTIKTTNYVVLDTETTGFSYDKDRMLCIGAVKIIDGDIDISTAFEVYIKQDYYNEDTVEIHGILKHDKYKTFTEEEAIVLFLDYIQDAVLVAHHATFDLTMINRALQRLDLPDLKNKVLDTMDLFRATRLKFNLIDRKKGYTLDEVAEIYDIDLSDRHTASGDALITAIAFLKSVNTLVKTKEYTLDDLFKI